MRFPQQVTHIISAPPHLVHLRLCPTQLCIQLQNLGLHTPFSGCCPLPGLFQLQTEMRQVLTAHLEKRQPIDCCHPTKGGGTPACQQQHMGKSGLAQQSSSCRELICQTQPKPLCYRTGVSKPQFRGQKQPSANLHMALNKTPAYDTRARL